MRREPGWPQFPQRAGFRIETRKPDPAILYESIDARIAVHDAQDSIAIRFDDER